MAGSYPEPVIAKCGILETILHRRGGYVYFAH